MTNVIFFLMKASLRFLRFQKHFRDSAILRVFYFWTHFEIVWLHFFVSQESRRGEYPVESI